METRVCHVHYDKVGEEYQMAYMAGYLYIPWMEKQLYGIRVFKPLEKLPKCVIKGKFEYVDSGGRTSHRQFEPTTFNPSIFDFDDTYSVEPDINLDIMARNKTHSSGIVRRVTCNNFGAIVALETSKGDIFKIDDNIYLRNNEGNWVGNWTTCDLSMDKYHTKYPLKTKPKRWRPLVYKLLEADRLKTKYHPQGPWFAKMIENDKDLN